MINNDNYTEKEIRENESIENERAENQVNFILPDKDSQEFKTSSSSNNTSSTRIVWSKVVVMTLIIAIVGGLSIGAGIGLVNQYFTPAEMISEKTQEPLQEVIKTELVLDSDEMNTVQIIDDVGDSVVGITSRVSYTDWFDNQRTDEGSGSGVIFKKDEDFIYILTNNHVIDGANELLVEMHPDEFVTAEVIGGDELSDLAVIAIENIEKYNDIKPVEFGDSEEIKPGQKVIAIGNPLGYNNSVTVGVVSALGRKLEGSNEFELIQTDAAINPGNSGGALMDSSGKLIGINTIKISSTQVEGIGFAIPVNSAKPILEQILDKGYVSRPYLGIYGREVNEEVSELYEIPMGIFVSGIVPGSGAEESDLRAQDIIIAIDDKKTFTMSDLTSVLKEYNVGDTVTLKVIREGQRKLEIDVTLTQRINN